MFNRIFSPLLIAACAVLSLTGCSTTVAVRPTPAPVVVYHDRPAPPPPIVEEYAPRQGYVWVRGHYRWNGHRYIWVRGHYRAV